MDSARAMDAIRCRCFLVFLDGVASKWFIQLPSKFISTFDELAMKFLDLDQFKLHASRSKDVMSMSGIFQGLEEPLKGFLNIFNPVVTKENNSKENIV